MGRNNLTMVGVGVGKDVLDQVVAVLITSDYSKA